MSLCQVHYQETIYRNLGIYLNALNVTSKTSGPCLPRRLSCCRFVAGGPDEWSRKRLQLWQKGNLFDLEVKCNGMHVMRASKVDLAVYSGYFQTFFDSQFPEAASQEVNIEGAEAAVLESIIKALYEKEVLASISVP